MGDPRILQLFHEGNAVAKDLATQYHRKAKGEISSMTLEKNGLSKQLRNKLQRTSKRRVIFWRSCNGRRGIGVKRKLNSWRARRRVTGSEPRRSTML
jgi:hypothetical protein